MMDAHAASKDSAADFSQEIGSELDQARRVLSEVTLMLEQSQVELAKLTQRNTAITGHLQQMQAQFDTLPRPDIRMAYNAALDSQQRLLVMRGQLEKLQSDQAHLQKSIATLEKIQQYLTEGDGSSGTQARSGSTVLEMVMGAQESERQRLSRQMHDGPAQALSNFIVQTEIASRMFDMDATKAKEELDNLKTSAMSTFQKVRNYIFELRPMMLDDLGFIPTIRRYLDSFKEQNGVNVQCLIQGQERRLAPYLEAMVFRSVQELVGNSLRHNEDSPVKPAIEVKMYMEEGLLKVTVSDNGKGFSPQSLEETSGLGLKLIRERVEMLGGEMDTDAAVGQGCRISFQIPVLESAIATTSMGF